MALTPQERAAVFLALNPNDITDFETRDLALDVTSTKVRTGLAPSIIDTLHTDTEALADFRLDPNSATLEQFARMPDLEAEGLGDIDNARPFYSLSELEAASKMDADDIASLFDDPDFELAGTHMADQFLIPAPDVGFIVTAEELPDAALFEALGFRTEARPGEPPRMILYQDNFDAAALNAAKALAGGRLVPAMRDADGIARFYVPGWLDVWFHDDVSRVQAETLLARSGLLMTAWHGEMQMAEARLAMMPANRDVLGATLDVAKLLRDDPISELAEPKQFPHEIDPEFDEVPQDFLNFGTGDPHWHRAMIRLDQAHAVTRGSPDVTVFVIDSGINLAHPDLAPALRSDWTEHDLDFGCGPASTIPDARGVDHGTGVSSLAVGQATNTSVGVQGVAPDVKLIPIRIEGRSCDYNNRAMAIRQAVNLTPIGVRGVINMSWQTEGSHEGVYLALKKAATAGLAIVTSAGNYRSFDARQANKPHYPSGYGFAAPLSSAGQPAFETIPEICSVGAVSSAGVRASYSYFGDGAVSLAAPGGESGGPGQSMWIAQVNPNYGFGQGTSFSAPLVSGAIALVLSQTPDLSARAAIARVKDTAKPTPASEALGAGVLDVFAAIGVDSVAPPQPDPAPTPQPVPEPCDVQPDTPVPDVPDVDVVSPPTRPDRDNEGVDVNTASATILADLPMLGPYSAGMIVAARTQNGPFGSLVAFRHWLGADDWVWSHLATHVRV